MGERSGPEPGRDCSDQNRISLQFQSARILRHSDIHVARPNMTHGPKIGDQFDIDRPVMASALITRHDE